MLVSRIRLVLASAVLFQVGCGDTGGAAPPDDAAVSPDVAPDRGSGAAGSGGAGGSGASGDAGGAKEAGGAVAADAAGRGGGAGVGGTDDGHPDRDSGSVLDADADAASDAEADGALGSGDFDSDGDGLPDKAEVAAGTSPTKSDSDGDGVSDLVEVAVGTDPLVPTDNPGAHGGIAFVLPYLKPTVPPVHTLHFRPSDRSVDLYFGFDGRQDVGRSAVSIAAAGTPRSTPLEQYRRRTFSPDRGGRKAVLAGNSDGTLKLMKMVVPLSDSEVPDFGAQAPPPT